MNFRLIKIRSVDYSSLEFSTDPLLSIHYFQLLPSALQLEPQLLLKIIEEILPL